MIVIVHYNGKEYQTPYTSIAELLEDCDDNYGIIQTCHGDTINIKDIERITAHDRTAEFWVDK